MAADDGAQAEDAFPIAKFSALQPLDHRCSLRSLMIKVASALSLVVIDCIRKWFKKKAGNSLDS